MSSPLTIPYKKLGDKDILVDVFVPKFRTYDSDSPPAPVFVYFHGGGMTAGDRTSWFPTWMLARAHEAGYIFLSPDYHLMAPSSGHDVLADVQDLFSFIDRELNERLENLLTGDGITGVKLKVDSAKIIVAGSSAGGLCAYLAGAHAKPRPRCVVSLYGMGGDFLTAQYLSPKHKPFFLNREMLSPSAPEFRSFVYPFSLEVREKPTIVSPLSYHPETGYPTNPRMQLARLYLQMGEWLDYWTGQHQPSLSGTLRRALKLEDMDATTKPGNLEHIRELIPAEHQVIFPQLYFSNNGTAFPPTFLLHGRADTAVHLRESENVYDLLERAGIEVILRVVDGKEHSFDYEAGSDSEGKLKWLFDEVFVFIKKQFETSLA